LRQALADANDGYTINFAVTGTIGLTSGELLVGHTITISGPGAENLAVNGNGKNTVFHVATGETATISGLTITNGSAGFGGGIHNDHATLTLNNCTISGNTATSNQGGGIYNDAQYIEGEPEGALLDVNNCLVTGNSGGGIYNNAEGGGIATLQITNSTFSNNSSSSAIYSHGFLCQLFCGYGTATVQITNSSINDNPGGAIYSDTGTSNSTTVSITNSTISGNAGNAIHNSTFSTLSVGNSTISGNSGGIYNDVGSTGADVSNTTMSNDGVELRNDNPYTLFMGNIFNVSPGGHSIVSTFGPPHSFGYNISSDDGNGYLNGPGDQINTDPLLGPLQDNGGPTLTHALLPGSPAINAGDPNFVGPPDYDQRGPGYDRVRNGRIDIGSFEVQEPLPTPTATPTPAATTTATATVTPTSTPTPTHRPNMTPRPRPTPPPRP
jgi:hypothetical protein